MDLRCTSGGIDYYDYIKDEKPEWVDLAPDITRQRAIIEGTLHKAFAPTDMVRYCKEISTVLNMTPVSDPKTDYSEEYGWCCFMHWKESGLHIYSWENRKPTFFSIDIYTCKSFEPKDAARYTEQFFEDNLIKLTWRE